MADFSKLINDITASIKANGVGDITGNVLQARLLELISAANEGKQDVIADLDTIRTNAQQAFTQIQTILGPDTTPAIVKFQEIINFLEGISDSESLDAIIKSIESQIAGKQDAIIGLTNDSFLVVKEDSENALKNAATALNNTQGLISSKQDKITDLEAIREGATLGKTALQKEVYTGTVSGVKMNNTTKNPVNGIVDLGTVITQHQDISGKVDKVEGKQLSTEDFTTALKMKLEGWKEYDDSALSREILSLKVQLETLIGGNASEKIDSFNEIIAFLDSVKDSEDLASVIASIEEQIALKADIASLAKVATSGSYKDLSNVPTKLSDFLNDEVYLSQALADTLYIRQDTPTLSTFATKDDLKGKQDAITGLTNESFASIKENELTALQNAAAALNTAQGLVSTKQDKIDGLTNEVFVTIKEDVDSALKNAASALNTANGLVSSKQDKITDLATIRSNASLGASAYNTLSSYNLQDISENASLGATAYSSLSGYLPLSGGTIEGNFGALTIKRNYEYASGICFSNINGVLGYIGITQDGTAQVWDAQQNANTLLHSGNIGSYTPKAAQGGIDALNINLNHVGYGYIAKGWNSAGPALAIGSTDGYTMLIQQKTSSHSLFVSYKSSGGEIQPWKTIAFTDSTVDKAKSVVDANGNALNLIHSGNIGEYALKKVANVSSLNAINAGEFFYSSYRPTSIPKGNYVGGVTLPTFQDAANDYRAQLAFSTEAECFVRRYMNGSWGNWKTIAFTDSNEDITFANEKGVAGTSVNGNKYKMLYLSNANNLVLGYHTSLAGLNTKINGDSVYLNYGYNHATGLLLNNSGNVTIGDSDLAQTSVKLYVDGTSNFNGEVTIGGRILPSANNSYSLGTSSLRWSNVNTQKLSISAGSYIAALEMDGSSLKLDKELKITAGGTSDITPGIACAMKANLLQATNLFAQNIILGASTGSASNLALNFQKYTSISNTAPSGLTTLMTLSTEGELTASAFYMSSDETLKDFGKDIEIDFDRLKNLPKKYFTWKSGGDKQIGTSAQEVQKLFPEIVGKKADGTLTVDYSKLTMPALAAIDKLYTENQELKARMAELERRIYG